MEIEVVAPQDGVIKAFMVKEGDSVEDGQTLVTI